MMRKLLLLTPVCLFLFCKPSISQQSSKKKNIILIISDDHRFDAVGIAGNKKISTPNLDALAQGGFYFPQATIHTSQCSPSRSTLLSGLPPHLHGVFSNDVLKDSDWSQFFTQPTLPQLLQSAGYHTLLSGKWHVPADPWKIGFEEVRYWLPGGAGVYKDPQLAFGNTRDKKKITGFTNEIFAKEVISFLQSPAAKEKPFFVWFSATAPHAPYKPNPKRIEEIYAGKTARDLLPPAFLEKYTPGDLLHYYEAISFLDELVGRIMKTLDETQLNQETIIVFIGDNGLMMGSRGLKGKVNPYEESVRVPLIIRLPQKNDSVRRVLSPVSSLDLSPTILSLAGIKQPEAWPGRSFSGWLVKNNKSSFDYAVSEWADNQHQFGYYSHRLIRTMEYKLILWEDAKQKTELYDLVKDPAELSNVADTEGYKSIQKKLMDKLIGWMKETKDPALGWKNVPKK
jgi:N-acetylglucosamine-6-sulfatase